MEKKIRHGMKPETDQESSITFITPFEAVYPEKLRNIPDMPAGLYVRGKMPVETGIAVAVIGARDCSDYGRYVAERLGAFLGENGVTVVSGMARGIDGISQWAALEAGGSSVAVLGCGADICYPAGNRALFDRLLEQGTILSEYPPGTPPRAMNFPARNRIVSGLADAVVVVEARNRSGTLITVDMALEQGREVFVVPGRVTDRLSDGCNRLIKQGAGILLSPEELLEELRELKDHTEGRGTKRQGERTGEKAKCGKERTGENTKCGKECTGENAKCGKEHTGKNAKCGKERIGENAKCGKERTGENTRRDKEQRRQDTRCAKERITEVPPELRGVYQALDFYPQSAEQIAARLPSGISPAQAAVQLVQLCMEDRAVQVSPGYFKSIHR